MVNEKKPSIYSDRGNIGSAEELDEYGVWVKSEPQVISSGADVQKSDDFDDSMFNTQELSGDDSSGIEDIDFPDEPVGEESFGTDFEDLAIPDDADGISSSSFNDNDFDVPTVSSIEKNIENVRDDFEGGSLSTQLLKKIASELSSIRGELHELKKEFSTIRSGDKEGFFSEEDDETIALTGDEMDNILSTSDDDAASQETNKAEVKTMANILGEDEDETIALTGDEMDNILNSADFTEEAGTDETSKDDLGEYDDETIALTGDEMDNILNTADFTEEAGTEESIDNSLSADLDDVNLSETDSSLSGLDFDDLSETTVSEESGISEGSDISEESDVSEESDIAIEDTPSIEDDVVEESELAMDDFDMSALDDGASTESVDLEESDITEEIADSEVNDLVTDDFDMSALGGDSTESADLETSDVAEESADSEEIESSAEDEVSEESEPAVDDFDMSALDDDTSTESADSEESDISIDDVVSLDDSDDLGSELSMDDFDMSALDDDISEESADLEASDVVEESAADDEGETKQEYIDNDIADLGVNLDSESMDEQADLSADALDENAEIEIEFDTSKDHEELEELREKGATPVTFPPENSAYLEEDDHINLDLSEAVIDEPELSTEGIDEPLTEPSLDMDSLDDLSITGDDESSIDDLDIDIDMPLDDIKEDEQDLTLGGDDLSIDEHVIPEGFEAEIQETPVPLDEDIEEDITVDEALEAEEPVDTEEAAPVQLTKPGSVDKIEDIGEIDDIGDIADIDEKPAKAASAPAAAASGTTVQKGGNFQLPSDLKKELKNILSYMDQLLESLPEEKIEEFAKSEYFDSYKKLFKELGLV